MSEFTLRRLPTSKTNFSTSVARQRRAKVLKEAKPLLNAHLKCKEIWNALQQADYKKEGVLNDAALIVLFDMQGKNLHELLLVKSFEELQELLDDDEDGFLNEDEQILLFSTIKERMQDCADDLCEIHEYALYKDMMKAIRTLEKNILEYQKVLRSRRHQKELNTYYEIGQQKLEAFRGEWKKRYQEFYKACEDNLQQIQERQQIEMQNLEQHLEKDQQFVKVKPKTRLKDLQVQEKIVAAHERYAEAHQIRNELKHLEVSEQNRVQNKIQEEALKRIKNLENQHQKEVNQTQVKNENKLYKLKIQEQQEYTRLQKEIKLHFNDITKNQNLASRIAERVGKSRDELRRTKEKSRRLQQYLKESKEIKSYKTSLEKSQGFPSIGTQSLKNYGVVSNVSSKLDRLKSASPLKESTKRVTKFYIMPDTQETKNSSSGFFDYSSLASKTNKLLAQSRKTKNPLPSITSFYNDNLELIDVDN